MKYIIIGMINIVLSLIMFKVNSVGIVIIPTLMLGVALWLFESTKKENKNKLEKILKIVIMDVALMVLNGVMIGISLSLKEISIFSVIVGIVYIYIWEYLILKILGINTKIK